MKIVAYKCEDTGRLFESVGAYRAHRRSISTQKRRETRAQYEYEEDSATLKALLKDRPLSVLDLGTYLVKTQEIWVPIARKRKSSFGREIPIFEKIAFMTQFRRSSQPETLGLNFDMVVSNSHSCPRGGVTNFIGDPTRPRHYAGWRGQIELVVNEWDGSSSDLLKEIDIHSGSGGGGMKHHKLHLSYDVKLFFSDWYYLDA